MFNLCIPNEICSSLEDIVFPEGITHVFTDFDNTLMPWHSTHLSDERTALLKQWERQYKVVIATNGSGRRFTEIKKEFAVLANLQKPTLHKIYRWLYQHSVRPEQVAFVGDNLITDIYTANKCGMYTIKVKPLRFVEHPMTKFYRLLEAVVYLFRAEDFKRLRRK